MVNRGGWPSAETIFARAILETGNSTARRPGRTRIRGMTSRRGLSRQTMAVGLTLALFAAHGVAQTRVTAPSNKFDPKQDVQLGREAAAEVEKQLPVLRDAQVSSYVDRVGQRLVRAIPSEFRHRGFAYRFRVVDLREINAFALPGGPMYLHRGMLQAARSEAEIAGVMAHEISHVALRHGTAQASRAQNYQIGAVAGAILGAIIGGTAGQVVAEGSQFGLGVHFLRYTREYERDADMLGAQIMARAGYDPRAMAAMFETIQKQGGRGGPEWLSSHPNPGNRSAAIQEEARALRVQNPVTNTAQFNQVQARLKQLPPARSMQEVTRQGDGGGSARNGGGAVGTSGVGGRVEPPSSRQRAYRGGDVFEVRVPANWRELPSGNAVWFAPEGAYGSVNGQQIFTHGMQFGVAQTRAGDLEGATRELLGALQQGNPNLRQAGAAQRARFGGRQGLTLQLRNRSEVTGHDEVVQVYTTQRGDGTLFYGVAVAPQQEWRQYSGVFNQVAGSVRVHQ
jgi:beta-barrel assembly-enhancing protease